MPHTSHIANIEARAEFAINERTPRRVVVSGGMPVAIRKRRNALGMTLDALAAEAGISRSYLSEIETGKKTVNARRLEQIARVLQCNASDLIAPLEGALVAVAGKVGAGARVELVDAYAKGAGEYHVEAPADVDPSGIVAVEVEGDSMAPMIQPGSVLLFTREFQSVDPSDLGRVVVCETEDGRVWVKQIKAGREPGTFDLYSANAGTDPIYGQRVKWASRLRRIIPPEDVRRIEEAGAD